jgi:hypothetical protein
MTARRLTVCLYSDCGGAQFWGVFAGNQLISGEHLSEAAAYVALYTRCGFTYTMLA